MMDTRELRFKIGDRIYASCFTDHSFAVKVHIAGIAQFDLANNRYQSVMFQMFNSDNKLELYENYISNTTYYYICEVLEITEDYDAGDYIILSDGIIKEIGTYYLNTDVSLHMNISFSTVTNFRSTQELMDAVRDYLISKNVDSVEIREEKSYEEKLEYELEEYRSIILSLKGLKSMESLVDKIGILFNTLVTKISDLLNLFENKNTDEKK